MPQPCLFGRLQTLLFMALPLITFAQAKAATITLQGTMSLVWQYDLRTNTFNSIEPVHIDVRMTIDDAVSGRIVFGETVRTLFGQVHIESPLFRLLGFPTTGLSRINSFSSAQSNNGHWNETWLTFSEDFSGPNYNESRWIEFFAGPVANPGSYNSSDLRSHLLQVGNTWSMRDDGAGLQNLLQGTLDTVTIDTSVPEPLTALTAGLACAVFLVLRRLQYQV